MSGSMSAASGLALRVLLVLAIAGAAACCGVLPAGAQSLGKSAPRLLLRAGGGLSSPVGGTGGIANQGWNLSGDFGYRITRRFGLMLDGQFQQAGIGNNVLAFELLTGGNYRVWTGTLNPWYTFWQRGKFSGYAVAGGGYSRVLTTFTGPTSGAQCYFFCSTSSGSGSAVYHYSSNQPMVDFGLGGTMRLWPGRRMRLYAEARWEDLNLNSNLAPYKNMEMIPVTVGVEW